MRRSHEYLGHNIALHRHRIGLTQEMLSSQLAVSVQAISKWERGLSSPDTALLPRLAETLEVSLDELFASPPDETPLLWIEEVPWDDDGEYRLALFRGKELLNKQTHLCRRGGSLIASIDIPEEQE